MINALAQSFILNETRLLTSIDLYFSNIDQNDNIKIQIRNTVNGYPGELIFEEQNLTNLTAFSSNATVKNNVKFKRPVLIESGVYYSFVVISSNKNSRLFISRIGNFKIGSRETQETQPSIGSCFSSQNGITWTAQQTDDIKYELYAAVFKSNTAKIAFKSKNRSKTLLNPLPFESEVGSNFIRVYHKNHGLNPQDLISISMFSSFSKIKVNTSNGVNAFVGQTLTSSSGSAIIKDIFQCFSCGTNIFDVYIEFINGYFADNEAYTTNEIIDEFGNVRSSSSGIITKGFRINSLNGIPQENVIKQHTVHDVDSIDSFIVNVVFNANKTGRFGSNDTYLLTNFKYDAFNLNGHMSSINSSVNWTSDLIQHGQKNGPLESKHMQIKKVENINLNSDFYLDSPCNHFSDLNISSDSISVKGSITTNGNFYSPIFNIKTFNSILISNQVTFPFLNLNVLPNSTNRFKSELNSNDGTTAYKYVSRDFIFNNPAYDLRIIFDAYIDANSDIKLYYKKISSDDISFSTVNWVELTGFKIRNSRDLDDFAEIDFVTDNINIIGWDNKKFIGVKFKIVGTTTNSSKPPLFKNFRQIALT